MHEISDDGCCATKNQSINQKLILLLQKLFGLENDAININ